MIKRDLKKGADIMKGLGIYRWSGVVFFLIVFSFCFVFTSRSRAESPPVVSITTISPQKITLTSRKSTIIESSVPAKRVSLANEEIADAMVLTPRQIYLTGKRSGVTNLTLWDENNKVVAIFDIEVLPDISRLKENLHEMFPDEQEIRVTPTHDSITLSGTVSGTAVLSQVLELAQSYAVGGAEGRYQVNNFLTVGGVHQVMLEVRASEMSRSLIRRLGINFNYLSDSGRQFGVSMLGSLSRIFPGASAAGAVGGATSNTNLIFRFLGANATWTFFIDALKEQGLIRILAEPTLITLSGKTAYFLAGGEFPVPVPQSGATGFTTITIQYKPFGVGLNFTPTVLSNGKISMEVSPEVSELNFEKAVTIQGFDIPSLTTRRVSTVIELADGQSFAIAGLLSDEYRQTVRKYPLFGDIPIIGILFRTNAFEKNETELVVIVTPHLVKPIDKAKQRLPTDKYVEPDDFEFYILGKLEGKMPPSVPSSASPYNKKGGLEGNFGHIVP